MSEVAQIPWLEANQRYLSAGSAAVRACLERHKSELRDATAARATDPAWQTLAALARDMPAPPALERLRAIFRLSPFEGDVLLLCAAMELDAAIGSLCAAASDPQRPFPTFSLALAVLPGAHWSALSPGGPLRRWRLVDVAAGSSLTLSPLRIDERVLHYLAGVQHLDERLAGLVESVAAAEPLVASQREVAAQLVTAWKSAAERGDRLPPAQLCGPDVAARRGVAAAACRELGLGLLAAPADVLPVAPNELDSVLRLWERESALGAAALYLDCEELEASDTARANGLSWLLERVNRPLIVGSRDRRRTRG
ncbi:MAG TPA: ATP-binding protein, partial [Chloroflexota bacterium]|nr:ATP-binding protein [Chloroflexota bacterium]